MAQEKEYFAFISYQRKDEEWADRLRSKLEHYRLPSSVRKQDASLPKEIRPIFRDALELAGGVLAKEIEKALQQSKFLIVICSPNSAKSPWVNKEIQTFIDLGREDHIIPFIIDGTPFSENDSTECFPPALRSLQGEKELLGININELGRDAAAIKVVARMFGLKFDTLWQRYEREKKRKRWMIIGGAVLSILCILCIAFCIDKQTQKANWNIRENQAKAVSEKALNLLSNKDTTLACRLLMEIMPTNLKTPDKPFVIQAESALRQATIRHNYESYDLPRSIQLSKDGNYVYIDYYSNIRRFCSLKTGKHILTIKSISSFQWPAITSPNGKIRAEIIRGDAIEIRSTTTDSILCVLKGHNYPINSINFSLDSKYLISSSNDGTIKIWDINRGVLFKNLNGHNHLFSSAVLCQNGKYVLSASSDARIWDIYSGRTIRVFNTEHYCRDAVFSPDEKYVATLASEKIQIFEHKTGRVIQTITTDCDMYMILFSMDGKSIISIDSNSNLYIWDIPEGKQKQKIQIELNNTTPIIQEICPHGKYIAASSSFGTIIVYESKTGKILHILEGNINEVCSIKFSNDCNYIISTDDKGVIYIWDIRTGSLIKSLNQKEGTSILVDYADITPDGKWIIASSNQVNLCIWNIKSGDIVEEPNGQIYYSMATMSHDGKYFALASSNEITIKDGNLNEKVQEIKECKSSIKDLAFSPDGKFLLSATDNKIVQIWDIQTGALIKEFSDVCMYAFSKDSQFIAMKIFSKGIYVWNLQENSIYQILDSPQWDIDAMQFASNNMYIAASSTTDASIFIWNLKSKEHILKLDIKNIIGDLFFSSEEEIIIWASFDSCIYIWDFPELQSLINQIRQRFNNQPLSLEERQKYFE